jgi:hypothetical protein
MANVVGFVPTVTRAEIIVMPLAMLSIAPVAGLKARWLNRRWH